MKFILLALLLTVGLASRAQYRLGGKVIDATDGQPLLGTTVTLTRSGDDKPVAGRSTDADGAFEFKNLEAGKYVVAVSFIGYKTQQRQVTLDKDVSLPTIRIKADTRDLAEVKVAGVLTRQEQRGDTTVFNADAFKVNPDASTEDLLKKMPGISISGDEVKAHGETVKRVLVDGKEFFGSDPTIALRNISADMVDKIEVYDRESDQSKFSGFSDGDDEKTINIMTKMGVAKGRFGNVYAGYGSDDRYEAAANLNFFHGDKRISIIGSANNINTQNFGRGDFMGVMNNSGINKVASLGFNAANSWDEKGKLEVSYFYGNTQNDNESSGLREYYLASADDSLRTYADMDDSHSENNNHRVNVRGEWKLSEKNQINLWLGSSWQNNDRDNLSSGIDRYDGNYFARDSMNSFNSNKGLSFQADLTWNHQLNKPQRTISTRLSATINNNDADGNTFKLNQYNYSPHNDVIAYQLNTNNSDSYTLGARLVYTEPFIADRLSGMISYSPNYTHSNGDKRVLADTVATPTELPSNFEFSPTLSSKKTTEYIRQQAGVGLNLKLSDIRITAQVAIQNSQLKGDQEYPVAFTTDRTFFNVLPSLHIRSGKRGSSKMLRFRYRTSTSAPSVTQMQDIVDVSNTRVYTAGNSQLKQQYSHQLWFHAMKSNPKTSHSFFAMCMMTLTDDYVAKTSMICDRDTVLSQYDNLLLPAGTQFDRYENLDGYYSMRANVNYGMPVSWLGSNVNFTLGADLSVVPSLYNQVKSKSNTYKMNGGLTIGSSFSENVDFTVAYNGSYNILQSNSARTQSYNYYSHTISCTANFIFFSHFVLNNSLSNQLTQGMGDDYDNNYIMWNAAVAYKFLSGRRAEIRFKVNDILDSNKSVSRQLSTTYVQTKNTTVIPRYFMLTFTYKLKSIGQQRQDDRHFGPGGPMGPPPGGMRPM